MRTEDAIRAALEAHMSVVGPALLGEKPRADLAKKLRWSTERKRLHQVIP